MCGTSIPPLSQSSQDKEIEAIKDVAKTTPKILIETGELIQRRGHA
jgi:hypothetical protein